MRFYAETGFRGSIREISVNIKHEPQSQEAPVFWRRNVFWDNQCFVFLLGKMQKRSIGKISCVCQYPVYYREYSTLERMACWSRHLCQKFGKRKNEQGEQTMLKKFGAIISAGAIVLAIGGNAAPAFSAEVTLSGASCFPIGSPPSKPFEKYVNLVNERGKGVVKIDLKGGAPAIGSPLTLTQKMSKGVYDIVGCTEAYFGNVLPEAPALRFSEYSWAELRQNGGLDYFKKLLAKKNIQYIARHHDFGKFHLWLSKPISGPNLKGLHLRVSPVYTAFFKSLGATVQNSNIAQVYTYMENGTVQGYGWPALGWVPSWIKVTKYRVEPGFYAASLHTLANAKKWKKLSAEAKAILTDVGLELEAAADTSSPKFQAALKKQKAWMAKEGMKTITFSGADGKKWLQAARDAGWNEVLKRSPVHGPKLKALFTR